MARGKSPLRIGLISVFALVMVICLSVMAMLAYTTAQATHALAQRQANATTELYLNESAAQRLVAVAGSSLEASRAAGQTGQAAVERLRADVDVYRFSYSDYDNGGVLMMRLDVTDPAQAAVLAGIQTAPADVIAGLHAQYVADDTRQLDVVLGIRADATYEVLAWKTSTIWKEAPSTDELWTGPE